MLKNKSLLALALMGALSFGSPAQAYDPFVDSITGTDFMIVAASENSTVKKTPVTKYLSVTLVAEKRVELDAQFAEWSKNNPTATVIETNFDVVIGGIFNNIGIFLNVIYTIPND